ncbi:MAG: superoxide dismutase family protein [Kofleriaceae bacterium]|nr:superoxide dismutase family protein [Kofleriaceae bacterium]
MKKTIFLSSIVLATSLASCKKDDSAADKGADKEKTKPAPAEVKGAEGTKVTPDEKAPEEAAKPVATDSAEVKASATIESKSGSKVTGSISFTMKGDKVWVEAKLTGLTPGEHGFHVHEKGDCSSPDGKSAGGHFNPSSVDHGGPDMEMHHAGDLGNIVANAEGVAEMKVELPTSFLSLDAKADNNIIDRAVVVHGGTDDLKSQPSGAAGPRVGCGVIKSL